MTTSKKREDDLKKMKKNGRRSKKGKEGRQKKIKKMEDEPINQNQLAVTPL